MERARKVAVAVILFATIAFAAPQNSEARPEGSVKVDLARTQAIDTKDNHHQAFANCAAAIEEVHAIIARMAGAGTFWQRGRVSYNDRDLSILSQHSNELRTSLSVVTQKRQLLVSGFSSSGNDLRAEEHLRKLDRIEVSLYSASSQLSHDLLNAKPGPGAPEIKWEIDALKRAADRWRAELRRFSKDEEVVPIRPPLPPPASSSATEIRPRELIGSRILSVSRYN